MIKSLLTLVIILLNPTLGYTLCLKDCKPGVNPSPSKTTFQYNEPRRNSHNFGDVKNSVLGDVQVRVGHEHIEIGGIGQGNQNYIDASVQATVILGDLKK